MTTTNANIPLTPGVARHIVEQLFQKQSLWKRAALVDEVRRIHLANGGLAGQQNPFAVVKKALSNLQEDGLVENHHYGHWKWVTASPVSLEEQEDEGAIIDTDDGDAAAEKVLGSGPELID